MVLGILELILLFTAGPDFEHIRTSYSLLLVWSNLEAGCLREPHFENFSEQEQTLDQDLSNMPCLFTWSGVCTYSGKCMGLSGSVLCALKVHFFSMSGPILSLCFWNISSIFLKVKLQRYVQWKWNWK